MIKIEKIITKRFILRQVSESDRESIFEILSDRITTRYLNIAEINTISNVDDIIKDYLSQYSEGNKFPFAIISKDSNEFVGVFLIKLDLYDPDCFEFTVYIKREFWNNGIYTEILPYMEDFAFNKIGTGNFRGFIMKSNKASAMVLLKSGFVLEKTFVVEGLPEMIESYLMTKEEYFARRKIMYKFNYDQNNKKEKDLFDTMCSISVNLFDENALKNLYFFDVEKIASTNVVDQLDAIKSWFSNVILEKSVILVNVDISNRVTNNLWNYIFDMIVKSVKYECIPTIIISDISEMSMSNYAQIRFGYSEKFVARSMKNIKKICALLETQVFPGAIYHINENE